MLLETLEYDAWQEKMPGRLTNAQPLQARGISAVFAWYEAKPAPAAKK
jgi:hypothetical protein